MFTFQLDSGKGSSEEGDGSDDESKKTQTLEKKGKYIPPKLASVPYGKLRLWIHVKSPLFMIYKTIFVTIIVLILFIIG